MVVKEGSIDATIGRTLFGVATRTNPAPARSAALPARAAAPLIPMLPAIMQTLPKSPLCASVTRGFSFGIVFIKCIQVRMLQIMQDVVNKRFDRQVGRIIILAMRSNMVDMF
jgi:hypothetical protein